MEKEHFYQVDLDWKEGRKGEISSPDLSTLIECATPPEFSGGVPDIWSPEHFYAASINSCFMTTFLAIAEMSKLEFEDFKCTTKIKLELVDRKFQITEAVISPKVTLKNGEKDNDRGLRILDKTKNNCLVTNSLKTEITLEPTIQ